MKSNYTKLFSIVLLLLCSNQAISFSCNNENSAIVASTPTSDFTLHNNGTVTHNPTNLMWMRCSHGQDWQSNTCTGEASLLTWQNALKVAYDLSFAGYSDWRVPNRNELESILEERCSDPAINGDIFPSSDFTVNTSFSWFWTSSPDTFPFPTYAFYIEFSFGNVSDTSVGSSRRVRFVRSVH